jgi:hypothetical protein
MNICLKEDATAMKGFTGTARFKSVLPALSLAIHAATTPLRTALIARAMLLSTLQ